MLISLLVTIVVFLVVLYIVRLVVAELGLPGNITAIIYAVIALVAFLLLLNFLGIYTFPLK